MQNRMRIPAAIRLEAEADQTGGRRRCRGSECGHCLLRRGNQGIYCAQCSAKRRAERDRKISERLELEGMNDAS